MIFNDFSFNNHLCQAIKECGFTVPTPIQEQAIPSVLEGRDLLGLAQTGTGKTAAFILPTVQHLMQISSPLRRVRALVIAPTRELAEQINDFTGKVIRGTGLKSISIYGGVGKQGQIARLREGIDIVIACPGRLLDILTDGAVDLSGVETLILDEADHMFDKGFLPDIRRILKHVPKRRQTLVFSATMPSEIRHLAESILSQPATVQINPSQAAPSISHRLYPVEQAKKTDLLVHLLKDEVMATTLVFTRTKHRAKNLAKKLAASGFKATSLQGNLSQNRRQEALDGFKNGAFNVLVATDIAARGIDVDGISHVVNYDMPDTAEAYIHRTGRTGRAARTGDAVTFATREDTRMIRLIEQSMCDKMNRVEVADLVQINTPARQAVPADGRERQKKQAAAAARKQSTGKESANRPNSPARPRNKKNRIFDISGNGRNAR